MDFASLATNFGVAVACLVALGLAVYKALRFVGEDILKPLATRAIKFMDDLSVAVTNQSQSLQLMAASQKAEAEQLAKLFVQQDVIIALVTKIHERVDRHGDKVAGHDMGSG